MQPQVMQTQVTLPQGPHAVASPFRSAFRGKRLRYGAIVMVSGELA